MEMLSKHSLFCQKCVAVRRKVATSCTAQCRKLSHEEVRQSVPLLQHSMGQLIKSLASVCLSVSVSVVALTADSLLTHVAAACNDLLFVVQLVVSFF